MPDKTRLDATIMPLTAESYLDGLVVAAEHTYGDVPCAGVLALEERVDPRLQVRTQLGPRQSCIAADIYMTTLLCPALATARKIGYHWEPFGILPLCMESFGWCPCLIKGKEAANG